GTGIVTATSSGPVRTDTAGPITILAPSLTIAKLDNQDPVPAGGFLGYTIIYTNVGNAAAQGIVITDTYDPNVTFVGAVPSPNSGTGGTVWSGSLPASLAPGESREIQIFTQVGSSLPVSTVLTNTVRISGLKLAQSMPFTQTTKVTVTSDLQLAKVQVSPLTNTVRVSETINYQLIYTNTGTAILHNVVLTETYDSAVEFVNAIPAPVSGTDNRRWDIGPLSAGQSGSVALTVIVKAPQPDGMPLVNQATIDSDETDPLATQSPPIAVRAPMLSLSKHTTATVVPANSIMTYTLAYTNSGSTHATGVVITDRLPLSVTFLSAIPPYAQRSDNLLTWNFTQVVTNSAGTIAIRVRVNDSQVSGTLFTNTARIAAAEIVSSFASLTNHISSAPNVTLSKSDGRTSAAAGQVLTYTLIYSNLGNAPALNVVITDRIPSNVTFVRCTQPCPTAGGVYTFSIGTLDASTSGQKTLTVRVSPTLPAGLRAITNTARIRTTTTGDNPTDDFAQDVDAISTVPVLDISASFNAAGPYPGKVITHTIRYTNVAAIDTTGVIVGATKSPYVTYLPSGSSGWTELGGNTYTWYVGDLGAHQSGVLTFVVSLPLTFTQVMSAFVNTFVIADNGPGGAVPAMDIFTATTGVPDLVIESVTFSPGQVVIGTWFTATVVIRNLGQGTGLNPFNGGGTAVDAFIDPSTPPPSSGWDSYGDSFDYVDPVPPGMTTTGTIAGLRFGQGQDFVLYFKIDNWDCHPLPPATPPCTPPEADHGLVPESDETNNVYGPVTPPKYRIFLPFVSKNYVPTFPTFLPHVSKNR
ncbi:MAG TPA: hypothetical protein VFL17_16195, partial [Anaerolineae bacterium]|nr:hypothetical protein [Anaerolineae bacterium]